jgi:hypothetical protein
MRYATPEAFRAALEDRLKDAQNETVGLSRLRKRVVFERLLARLTAQAAGEWVLKGGFALELRLDELSRSTKDIDVDWSLSEEDATERLLDAADLDIGDMFERSTETVAWGHRGPTPTVSAASAYALSSIALLVVRVNTAETPMPSVPLPRLTSRSCRTSEPSNFSRACTPAVSW